MKFQFVTGNAARTKADLLALPVFDSDLSTKKAASPTPLMQVDKALRGLLLETASEEGFKGKSEQQHLFHTHRKSAANRVLMLGLGSAKSFDPESLRMAAGRAAKVDSVSSAQRVAQGVVGVITTRGMSRSVRLTYSS